MKTCGECRYLIQAKPHQTYGDCSVKVPMWVGGGIPRYIYPQLNATVCKCFTTREAKDQAETLNTGEE
jgi:hypothetical protein